MRYCDKAFNFVHIDWNGNVYLCAWTTIKIGNLLENDLETIWNCADAKMFRKSIIDGTYRYCLKHTCPHCNNNTLPDLYGEEWEKAIIEQPYPTRFELSYDYICNHKCPSCRHELFMPDAEYDKKMNIIAEKLLPYLNKAEFIDANGNGDMFASRYTIDLFSKLRPENPNLEFHFETNGVLCDREHWEKVKHLEKYKIGMTVTPNSYERDTYKYLAGGVDNYDKLMTSMKFISELRQNKAIDYLKVSMVVQDRNFREVPSFIRRTLDEFKADAVIMKPIYPWFQLTAEEYWFKDILNPLHPYFNEYQEIMKDPIYNDPRVFHWGAFDIHEKKEHPFIKYKAYYEFCLDLINRGITKEILADKISSLGRCAIYGAGSMGKFLYDFLGDDKNIDIACFIDRFTREREYNGVVIKRLFGNDFSHIDTIIVTPVMEFEEIRSVIVGEGYTGKIVSMYDLIGGERKDE